MELDDIAKNIKEVSLAAMFRFCIPGDDPPADVLARAHCTTVGAAEGELGSSTAGSSRKPTRSENDDHKPPLKRTLAIEICKLFESLVEIASAETSSRSQVDLHVDFQDTGGYADCKRLINPPGGIFLNMDQDTLVDTDEEAALTASKDEARRTKWLGHTPWANLVSPIEVEVEDYKCAFTFYGEPKHRRLLNRTGNRSLERLLKHVGQLFIRHHRTHVYSLYVFCHQARILYFDRAYTLVSESFEYGTSQETALHAFFWRIAHMSREQLGFDPTVVPAHPHDVKAMLEYGPEAPTNYIERQLYRALSRDPDEPGTGPVSTRWPPYQLTMCGRRYIIGRPTFASPTLYGRCTRGYLAYDIEGKAVRFLKDSWRPDLERVQPEHKVYERLKANGVTENVLTCLGYENVPDSDGSWQLTRTHELISSTRPARGHYRILFEQVCRPLIDFTDFGELTERICEAIY
ncbi:hypothetical protein L226DRAFT_572498, partial [Lentinus tigrinus ALCF2SS1-7]